MKLFRDPAMYRLPDTELHHRVMLIMEPKIRDIRRIDLLIRKTATPPEVLRMVEWGWQHLIPAAEGADFSPVVPPEKW